MRRQGAGFRGQGSESRRPQGSASRPGSVAPWNRFIGPAVVLLAAAIATAPLLLHGPSCGHDFDFHLVSWLDCLNAWRHGLFYPHWSPSSNFGAGEPRFVFYPPLTWMLGAALGAVLPWTLVPAAMTFLVLAAAGLGTRALARQALDDAPATLAGCAALFSGYALFTAYERTAFGELTGGFWIPLLLLFSLRGNSSHPFHKERGEDGAHYKPAGSAWKRALDGSATPLALVVAAAWLSNAPVGVMACYLLAAAALAAALLAGSWAPVLRAAIAALLGLGLSAVYLIPAAWEQRWIDIRQATDDPGERVENSWLFAHHANPRLELHDVELHRVSLLAVSMLAVALAGLLAAWGRDKLSIRTGHAPQKSFIRASAASEGPAVDFEAETCALDQSVHPESQHLRLLPRSWWLILALIPPAVLLLQLPPRCPSGICCPSCGFCSSPGAGSWPLKLPWASSSPSPSGPPGAGSARPQLPPAQCSFWPPQSTAHTAFSRIATMRTPCKPCSASTAQERALRELTNTRHRGLTMQFSPRDCPPPASLLTQTSLWGHPLARSVSPLSGLLPMALAMLLSPLPPAARNICATQRPSPILVT